MLFLICIKIILTQVVGGGGEFRLDLGDFPLIATASTSPSSAPAPPTLDPSSVPALPCPAYCEDAAALAGILPAPPGSASTSEPLQLPQVSQSTSPLLALAQSAYVVGPSLPLLPPVAPEPCPSSDFRLGLSPLELDLRKKTGNLGSMVDRPEFGKLVANRRSVRLAAK